jgi:hypothetical protein
VYNPEQREDRMSGTTLEFCATLERPDGTGTWTFLSIPLDLKALFGAAGQIRVRGTIDGQPFSSTALARGDGGHYLVVNGSIRDRIGVTAGSTVLVVLERDPDGRTVDVPEDFDRALSAAGALRTEFDTLAYSRRKEFVDWIALAKTSETRQNRIERALAMIAEDSSPKRPKRDPSS